MRKILIVIGMVAISITGCSTSSSTNELEEFDYRYTSLTCGVGDLGYIRRITLEDLQFKYEYREEYKYDLKITFLDVDHSVTLIMPDYESYEIGMWNYVVDPYVDTFTWVTCSNYKIEIIK